MKTDVVYVTLNECVFFRNFEAEVDCDAGMLMYELFYGPEFVRCIIRAAWASAN